jgi:hypothetical protein
VLDHPQPSSLDSALQCPLCIRAELGAVVPVLQFDLRTVGLGADVLDRDRRRGGSISLLGLPDFPLANRSKLAVRIDQCRLKDAVELVGSRDGTLAVLRQPGGHPAGKALEFAVGLCQFGTEPRNPGEGHRSAMQNLAELVDDPDDHP